MFCKGFVFPGTHLEQTLNSKLTWGDHITRVDTFDLGLVTLNFVFLADLVWAITQQPLMKEGLYLACDIIITSSCA